MQLIWKTLAGLALSASTTFTQAEQFSDGLGATKQIVTYLWVNAGPNQVYGVGLTYQDPSGRSTPFSHGTLRGKNQTFNLDSNNYVNSFSVVVESNVISYLLITNTNQDRIEVGTSNSNVKTTPAPSGYQLGGFTGEIKGHDLVDLGPIYVEQP